MKTPLIVTGPAWADFTATDLQFEAALDALPCWVVTGFCTDARAIDTLLGTHLTAELWRDHDVVYLDGQCAEARRLPSDANADHYRITLRPWLWWLTLSSDNRVFQNLKTSEIVSAVFQGHGFTDYELRLTSHYMAREYCVQYAETDFAFVSRLLEEEGIFYFFEYASGKHTLVLADSNTAFPLSAHHAQLAFLGQRLGGRELQGLHTGSLSYQAVVGGYQATDYAFTTPTTSLYGQAMADETSAVIYEHPGGFLSKERGTTLGRLRIEALRSQQVRLLAESDCRSLVPGHRFTLQGHDDPAANIEWVVTRLTLQATPDQFANQFEAIPLGTTYHPLRNTPKPRMHTQTARVVGKAGEEIWTDQHGRIKLQFNWDRHGKQNETSSCWVRVMQAWSGKNFGAHFIPRIGQEVVVTFVDGDPDRPLITGCVYNGENALPYALPDRQTQSGFRTRSSKGGAGFHELRFDDKKDAEEVFLQSQKDFNVNILHDATHTVGNDETRTIQHARSHTIKQADDTLLIEKGHRFVTVQTGNETIDVKSQRTLKAGGDETRSVGGNFIHGVDGNYELTVKGNLKISVSGSLHIESGGAFSSKTDASYSVQAAASVSQTAGTSLQNKAGTSLENKAGTTLANEAGVSMLHKAGAEQTVEGGAMLTLKAGIVKIN